MSGLGVWGVGAGCVGCWVCRVLGVWGVWGVWVVWGAWELGIGCGVWRDTVCGECAGHCIRCRRPGLRVLQLRRCPWPRVMWR